MTKGRRQTLKVFRCLGASLQQSNNHSDGFFFFFFFFPPAGSFPLRGKALAGFGGQSLPDDHGWQYLPSISLVSHSRKQPEVQLVRERDPFRAGINPLTGNKAERAITCPGSDRPTKVKRFFFFPGRFLQLSPCQRRLHQPHPAHTHTGTKAGTSACGRVKRGKKRKNMTTLFGKQWCHTHLVSLQRPQDETGDSHLPLKRARGGKTLKRNFKKRLQAPRSAPTVSRLLQFNPGALKVPERCRETLTGCERVGGGSSTGKRASKGGTREGRTRAKSAESRSSLRILHPRSVWPTYQDDRLISISGPQQRGWLRASSSSNCSSCSRAVVAVVLAAVAVTAVVE